MDRDSGNLETPTGIEPEDYYYEGEYLIFTAAYHLKRGTCCGSGCRHCPWEKDRAQEIRIREQEPGSEGH